MLQATYQGLTYWAIGLYGRDGALVGVRLWTETGLSDPIPVAEVSILTDLLPPQSVVTPGGGGVGLDTETIQDMIASFLAAGSGIGLTYNDAGNALTIANTASVSNEAIDDRVAALLTAGSGISLTYNDAGNALTIAATGGASTTLYQQKVLDAGATFLIPFDGRMSAGLPLNLGSQSYPVGTVDTLVPSEVTRSSRLVIDGPGTAFSRNFLTDWFPGYDGLDIPFASVPTTFTIGASFNTNAIPVIADGSDGTANQSFILWGNFFGVELSYSVNTKVLQQYGASGYTGYYWQRTIDGKEQQGVRILVAAQVDGSTQVYVDGRRIADFTWARTAQANGTSTLKIGKVACDANMGGFGVAIRDFWYIPRQLTQAEARVIGV